MPKRPAHTPAKRPPSGSEGPHGDTVWTGGRFQMPSYVMEAEPYRPDLVLWQELPSGLLLAGDIVPPDAISPLANSLRGALDHPTKDARRQPARLRVADPAAEAELRHAFRDRFSIEVAPTPELDAVFQHFLANACGADEDASYLEGGRVPGPTVAMMFQAAAALYRAAPWEAASDDQVLRMDIPALGVEGACVSIIGALGESLGVIIFPSLLAFERFAGAAAAARSGGPLDLGGSVLSLDFWHTRDLPPTMRREIAKHGWTTVAPDAIPVVGHRDRDGVPRPVSVRDLRIATACALAVTSFFLRHQDVFDGEFHDPICESSTTNGSGVTVTLTMPYDAADLESDEDSVAPRIATSKIGRNDPCPCGSGKKYKKCCLDKVQTAQTDERRRAAAHDLDERMVWAMRDFATERYGEKWAAACQKLLRAAGADTPLLAQLSSPWSVYEAIVDGQRVVDVFTVEWGKRLTQEERDWLEAQRTARLSLWEITACEPGVAVSVRSLLSGEARRVRDVKGSSVLVARDAILARVADYGGASYFCGMHPNLLPPERAAAVVRAARRRAKEKGSSLDRPDEDLALTMVRAWTKAVRDAKEAEERPKKLVNTDGEDVLMTTDHFEFDPAHRAEVEAKLRQIDGVEGPASHDEGNEYTVLRAGNAMHRHWENTVLGRFTLDRESVRLETNSVERADALRAGFEAACGKLLKHRLREHEDPMSSAHPASGPASVAPSPPPEAQAALRELKAKHYAHWLDEPLPALSGKTPRQAVRSKRGREHVDLLLRAMENAEQRAGDAPFDFGSLRRDLRLDRE